jgi:dihydroorotase
MTVAPARAFALPGGTLAPGSPGDVTVLDLDQAWTVDARAFRSRSRNTPFGGWDLKGRAVMTVVGGQVVWEVDSEKRP